MKEQKQIKKENRSPLSLKSSEKHFLAYACVSSVNQPSVLPPCRGDLNTGKVYCMGNLVVRDLHGNIL